MLPALNTRLDASAAVALMWRKPNATGSRMSDRMRLRPWLDRAVAALTAAGIMAATVTAPAARADDYPSKPITLIVPFQAGLSADLFLRVVAESASKHLGQPVVVDNRAGANSALAATALHTGKPDGYLIAQMPIPIFRMPLIQKTSFDPLKDFTYIIQIAGYTFGVTAKADGPFKKWDDVVAFAKANPGKVTYATPGPLTTPNIGMDFIMRHSGIQLTHVPMKGGGESISAVLGGHVTLQVESPSWGSMVESGQMALLMQWGPERNPKWPNAPTLKELGYPFVYDSPFGLAGPKGMPPAIVAKLHDAFKKTLDDPKVIEQARKFDFTIRYLGPQDYAKSVVELMESEKATLQRIAPPKKE
jgi:tripartite-type tricarboxylate transporter receptor subunit TctC